MSSYPAPPFAMKTAPAWLMPTPWPQPRTVKRRPDSAGSQVKAALLRPRAARTSWPVKLSPPIYTDSTVPEGVCLALERGSSGSRPEAPRALSSSPRVNSL